HSESNHSGRPYAPNVETRPLGCVPAHQEAHLGRRTNCHGGGSVPPGLALRVERSFSNKLVYTGIIMVDILADTPIRSPLRAPRGSQLSCRNWLSEGALRML